MSLFVTSLNSGSNGNCYYVGNAEEAVLVDAGISYLETEKRMKRLGLEFDKLKAIFVSHEHSDHIRGVEVLSRKYQWLVYLTTKTKLNGRLQLDQDLTRTFCAIEPIQIGNLAIKAFSKLHDAIDPHSFVISCNNINVGVFTDIGFACRQLIHHFKQCHAAFLEANYDDEMLLKGRYPYHLKQRIRGGNGHLSNAQALQVFTQHKPEFMSHLFLSHLSKDNNCPDLVANLFKQHAAETKIIVASRYKESEVYQIDSSPFKVNKPQKSTDKRSMQLSMFA